MLLLTAVLLAAAPIGAHTVTVDTFLAFLRSPKVHETLGVEEVTRDEKLPRLLLIRVGPAWEKADPEKRRQIAEAWLDDWRHIVPQGIIAVLDQKTGKSLVQFDANGKARLEKQ